MENQEFTLADIKKNKVKTFLRNESGFKTIAQAKKAYGVFSAEEAYFEMM